MFWAMKHGILLICVLVLGLLKFFFFQLFPEIIMARKCLLSSSQLILESRAQRTVDIAQLTIQL